MAHQSFFQNPWNWLVRHKVDLFQFGWPFALYEGFNWVFDKGFFPVALLAWGPLWGAVIPGLTAFCINAGVFWLYDHMKVDWLKAHALRELADKDNKTKLEKLLTWHFTPRTTLREKVMGEIRFAVLLSYVDPVIVAIYYRDNHFNGVSIKDWLLLMKATFVAVVVWIAILEPLMLGGKFLWNLFS